MEKKNLLNQIKYPSDLRKLDKKNLKQVADELRKELIDVVSEGNLNAGSHSVTWDASQVSSGVYFINTEIGSDLNVQKVMLVK